MLLRARVLVPVTAPILEDGAVLISEGRIAAVGPWNDLRRNHGGPSWDLGDSVVFPGLINAHCHLDYTHFAAHLAPARTFTEWLQGVLALKGQWSYSEYAASWVDGARQLVGSGCTTVLDYEAVPELLPEAWADAPLRVVSAIEVTGVRSGRSAEEIVAEAVQVLDGLGHGLQRHRGALAPHAPYSTRPELLRRVAEVAHERGCLVTSHVAESVDEFEMFTHARGPMFDWLRDQRGVSDCGRGSPVRQVAEAGLLANRCLLAHVNCLADGDAELLSSGPVAVVHCPRSHVYFDRPPFPAEALAAAGVPICLGTDSLLSVLKAGRGAPSLSFLEELAAATRTLPGWGPDTIFRAATTVAAAALGRGGELGELREGAAADLAMVPFSGTPGQVLESIVHHAGPVTGLMVAGRWVIPPTGRGTEDEGGSR